MPPNVTFNNDNVFPTRYNEDGRIHDHNREPPIFFSSMPRSHASGGMSEDTNAEPNLPHDTPCQRNDLPIQGTYPFESEHPSPARAQNENPDRTSFLLNPLGEGPSRYGGLGASFSTPSLTQHAELGPPDNQRESHYLSGARDINTQSIAGPSGSRIIASVSYCMFKRWGPHIDAQMFHP